MSTLPGEDRSVVALLRDAARTLDASPALQLAARRLASGGFPAGAAWMALALGELRGMPPPPVAPGSMRAGMIKYGAATVAAAAVIVAAWKAEVPWTAGIPLAILAFYAVEAQGAFVMCAIADGSSTPWGDSRRASRAAGGSAIVTARIMAIAAAMLFGGLGRGGFRRAWCVGCLAVVLWYERVRR